MARTTNIPEYKVRNFMIKDNSVFTKYAEMMGFRIEYARKFGDDDIEYLVDRIEEILIKDGATDKQIASIKSDFLADFQRVAGQITRDPDRWDSTFARISKKVCRYGILNKCRYYITYRNSGNANTRAWFG